MKRFPSILSIMAISFSLFSTSFASFLNDHEDSSQNPSAAGGRIVYRKACVPCHGVNGDGNGPAAQYLNPKPRDFTKGTYKFRSTPSGIPTDEDLLRSISNGVPGTSMPAWERLLSEMEKTSVVQYIKSFSEKFKKRKPKTPITIPKEIPPATAETINEGKMIYALLKCWSCHGKTGRGDGPSVATLKDDWGQPIKPYDFTKGGMYKGGNSDADIFRTFTTGLSGTPMPAFVHTLGFTKESIKDFIAYEALFTKDEVVEIQEYVNRLVSKEEINALSKEEKLNLFDRRRWYLVHFVKSLSQKESLFYKLFVKDTEVTR